jgi:hypothetical protein
MLPDWDSIKNSFLYLKKAVPSALLLCFDVCVLETITILSS